MSILRVANLQFNASGTRRIDYDAVADDGVIKVSAAAIKLPVGDTASRPTLQPGMLRYNSQLDLFEGANSTTWGSIGGTVNFATANGWANTVATAGNNYTNSVGTAGNNYTNSVGLAGNNYTNSVGAAGNNYVNLVGSSANSWANAVGQNANVYAYATAVSIGGAGNNYTYFSIAPVWNTANAAFGVANTALQNTDVTLAGNLTVTGNVVANKQLTVTYTPTTTVNAAITAAAANSQGGTGYADFLRVTNLSGGATNPNKTFRLNSTGGIEIINSAYTATIFTLDNNGILATSPRGITSSSMPAGSILQVVSARNGDYYSTTSQSWTDITGLSLTITPTSSTSKIFLMLSFGRVTTNAGNLDYAGSIRILGNGSDSLNINGNASGSREKVAMVVNGWAFNADHCPGGLGCSGLESPATTSAITYKVQVRVQGPTFFMNGTPNNGDSGQTYHSRSQTSFTAWEIAQ